VGSGRRQDVVGVALYEPEIPGNAGNVARLCAATGAPLHLIGRLGFSFRHPDAKRSGMDYWQNVEMRRHVAYADFLREIGSARVWMFSTRGQRTFWDVEYAAGDVLLFGPESRGLPPDLIHRDPDRVLRIPMRDSARSLNLATSAGVALYEALRRIGWSPS
jgi:tRNA (cytidine/uridine-2'-O-)-methyltransferase